MLTTAMEKLSDREREIVRKYFWDKDTLAEIGEDLGVSRSRIHQIIKKSLKKIKKELEKYPVL